MPISEPNPVFPFVVGCGRSGTTLVRTLLDSHPAFAIPGETGFISDLLADSELRNSTPHLDVDLFAARLYNSQHFRRWGWTLAQLHRVLNDGNPSSSVDAIRLVYGEYARSQRKPWYGDKTPTYILSLPELAAAFPEGKFVHVVRDGRDVAAAITEQPWGPNSIPSALQYWRRHVQQGRHFGARLPANRYTEIRYEDLISDPELGCRKICEFLGVDFDSRMLKIEESAVSFIQGTEYPSSHERLLGGIQANPRDWRTQFTPERSAAAWIQARSELSLFDYSPPEGFRLGHFLSIFLAVVSTILNWRLAPYARQKVRVFLSLYP